MNRPRPTWRWGVSAIAVTFALVFAIPALQGDAPDTSTGFAPGEAGLRAAIDPETGELAIGAEAMRLVNDKGGDSEIQQMLSRSTEGLVEEKRPGGGVSVHLQGRFMSMSVARVAADGQVETLCTDSADQAESFLAGEAETASETDANGWEVR
jgi:hypothetical protein